MSRSGGAAARAARVAGSGRSGSGTSSSVLGASRPSGWTHGWMMPFMSRYRLSNSIPFGLGAMRSTRPCEASHSTASRITFGYFSAHQRKKAGTPTAIRRGWGVGPAHWRMRRRRARGRAAAALTGSGGAGLRAARLVAERLFAERRWNYSWMFSMAFDPAPPRTKRPPPRPTAYRNGRPIPVVALHQGHLPHRGPPFRAKAHDPDYLNDKKWEPGRATELAARLGMARAYDERITASERGWPAYDASADPHTRRWRQRQAFLQQAASLAPPRRNLPAGAKAGHPRPYRASTPQAGAAHSTGNLDDQKGAVKGCVRYWDGERFVSRQVGELWTADTTPPLPASRRGGLRRARKPWVSPTC